MREETQIMDPSTSNSPYDNDCGRSDDESSFFNGSSVCAYNAESENKDEIAAAESITVFRLKLIVITILLSSTIGVSFAVYRYIDNAETNSFEENFNYDAVKVFEAVGSSLALSLGAVDSFIVNMVAFAEYSNSTWPFVTVPKYAVSISKIRGLAKAFSVGQYQLVTKEQRAQWEQYSIENDGWVAESLDVQKGDRTYHGLHVEEYSTYGTIHGNTGDSVGDGPFLPQWQASPIVPIYAPYNWDGALYPVLGNALPLIKKQKVVIGAVSNIASPGNTAETAVISQDWARGYVHEDMDVSEPFSELFYPIFDSISDTVSIKDTSDGNFVGVFYMAFFWRHIIEDILPQGANGLVVVFENTCNQTFTYQINGPDVQYLGPRDLHNPTYDFMELSSLLNDLDAFNMGSSAYYTGLPITNELCAYNLRIYPSDDMYDDYKTSDPILFSMVAVCIFVFTSVIFLVYDYVVERRQKKVMSTAIRSNAIVKSLFPATVRDRMFQGEETNGSGGGGEKSTEVFSAKNRLKNFMTDGKSEEKQAQGGVENNSPIADLFTEVTVIFGDIAGFTAWSSIRQPTQVFTLLETVYGAFDAIATKRGVFKVETIGDCYMAVTGLPERREDHAIAMAKFAVECRTKFADLTHQLETTLGPGTGDLAFRFGLHSGPVTAGVLRGQKSRFQLFGDTVNTASRMESTCIRNKIQISQATANSLILGGKSHWLKAREDRVEAKGKGLMRTFWLEPKIKNKSVAGMDEPYEVDTKTRRVVNWYVEIFAQLIRQIMARHKVSMTKNMITKKSSNTTLPHRGNSSAITTVGLDGIKETIAMPEFDETACRIKEDPNSIELDSEILGQLHDYVMSIAVMYHDNPFHNIDHACHVGMSVAKLLTRIVGTDQDLSQQWKYASHSLHKHSYGIATDPLTQFACVFSALIHDVDHPGVSNAQLVKENTDIARLYNGKSVAEQNSLNLSWKLLMSPSFDRLREAICPKEQDTIRFQELVVNSVMATDILDKDLKNLRNSRWNRVFQSNSDEGSNHSDSSANTKHEEDQMNRQATIVIEHLLQASDVSHTMQHWHVYIKWNERFFNECYNGYLSGRAEKNPAENWYEGELGFFDFYIIPLAKKLKDCKVFGVASDEYLTYAEANRREWELKGKSIVADYLSKAALKRLNLGGML